MATDDPPSASEDAYAGGAGGDLAEPIGSVAQATAQAAQQRSSASSSSGAQATSVATLQAWLNLHGYASPPLAVDGKLGPKTTAAIKAFQKSAGLVVDGIPGPKTYAATASSLGKPSMPTTFVAPAGVTAAAPAAPAPMPLATALGKPAMPAAFKAPSSSTLASLTGGTVSPTGKKLLAGLGVLGVVGAVVSARRR